MPSGALLDRLAAADVAVLSASDRVAAVIAAERLLSHVQLLQARFVAAVADDADTAAGRDAGGPGSAGRFEVAAALRVSPVSAGRRIFVARELTGRLSAAGAALSDGTLTFLQALVLVEELAGYDDPVAVEVTARMLPRAALTVGRWRTAIRRTLLRIAPEASDRRAKGTKADRDFALVAGRDEAAWLGWTGPASPLLEIDRLVAELAGTPARDDTRTAAQRRHDTALIIFHAGLARYGLAAEPNTDLEPVPDGSQPGDLSPARVDPGTGVVVGAKRTRRRVPEGHIVLSLATYRGLAQTPGELDGYGPVTAATARGLATDGRPLRRVLVDADGRVVDVSDRTWPPEQIDDMLAAPLTAHTLDDQPDRYQPSTALGRYIDTRDRTCTAPWCTREACTGQHDHIADYAQGGPTTRANLQAACDRDNQIVKARLGWTTIRARDGTTAWISPTTGRTYTTEPQRYDTDS